LEGKDKFWMKTVNVIINQLVSSLRQRIDAYRKVREVFKVKLSLISMRLMPIRLENMRWQIYTVEICSLVNWLMK